MSILKGRNRLALTLGLAGISFFACSGYEEDLGETDQELELLRSDAPPVTASGERIRARGAFSCDFGVDLTQLSEPLGATIERDRIFLQRQVLAETSPDSPGMLQKHIPIGLTSPATALAGGRYLFQGRWQAARYEEFINHTFVYPGNFQFLERPEFFDPECRDWSVIAAWRFEPLTGHTAMRTERFDTGRTSLVQELLLAAQLFQAAPGIIEEAAARGYAEVQLVHSLSDHKVQLVYYVSRMLPPSPELPDVAALERIATDSQLGADLANDLGLDRVLDRSAFVLHIWRPYAPGDHGEPALWPNSPPFPGPACGDGVCVPSLGESASTCSQDCTPGCGDAICQEDESLHACPSDCELPFVD